jgi:AcrR family transcriptional regulator
VTGDTGRARPRRRTQSERRAATREKILAAAGRVFAERGYHGASLDTIAERAGVSKGSIIYTFGTKQELFAALLRERVQQRLEAIRALLADGGGGDPRPTRDAGALFLDAVTGDPRWGPLFFEFVAQAARDSDVRPAFAGWLKETRAALTELIDERLQATGVTSPVYSERLAILVSALANGMLLERMFDRRGVPADLLGEGLGLLARGVSAGD